MSNGNRACERDSGAAVLDQMGQALHDMCQPLTTLQCRMELAELLGTIEAYREVVAAGMQECSRLVENVGTMREILRLARSSAEVANPCPGSGLCRRGEQQRSSKPACD